MANVPERYRNEWGALVAEAEKRVQACLTTVQLRAPADFGAGGAFDRYERAVKGIHTDAAAVGR